MSGDDPGQMPRAAARRELQSRRIEAIDEIDVEAIANYHQLFVVEGGLDGAEGRSVTGAGAGIIRIRRDITKLERRRSVIAHEIGHCILHKTGSVRPCSEGDLFRYEEGNREAEANWFAAELLMPGRLFAPHCDVPKPSFDAVKQIAGVFHTTLTATAIRPSVPTSLETVVPRYLSTDGRRMVLKTCPSQPKFQVERPPPPRATASRASPA